MERASALIFLTIDEGRLLVASMIAAGTMLAVLLSTTNTGWMISRIGLPVMAGAVAATVMCVHTAMRDVPFKWWLWALTAACVLRLGAIRVDEAFRLEIEAGTPAAD